MAPSQKLRRPYKAEHFALTVRQLSAWLSLHSVLPSLYFLIMTVVNKQKIFQFYTVVLYFLLTSCFQGPSRHF